MLSLSVGASFIFIFYIIIQRVQMLAEDNTFRVSDTLHLTADVYLSIPAHKQGKGKISLSVKGSYHELDAVTEQDTIPSGAAVKIVKIENNLLVVEKI